MAFRAYGGLRPVRRPIFVIGAARSGTTVLTRMLAQTSQVVDWSEASQVWDPVGYPWEADKVRRPQFGLDPQAYMDSVLATNSPAYFRAVPGIFAMHLASQPGRRGPVRLVNKSAMHPLRIDLIESLFPDACYVNIYRDPRAVVRSYVEKTVAKLPRHPRSGIIEKPGGRPEYNVDGRKYTWLEMVEAVARAYDYIVCGQMERMEEVPEARKISVRYEEMAADLHALLRQIDQKFGLDSAGRDWSQVPERLTSRNTKYLDEYGPEEISLILAACSESMARLGYLREGA